MCKKEGAKERNVVVRRHLKSIQTESERLTDTVCLSQFFFLLLALFCLTRYFSKTQRHKFIKCANDNDWINISLLYVSDNLIFHMLTGVKRLASDNTDVSGTPSLDNYITLVLHCFHSLLVILLKSQWLESLWQRRMTASGAKLSLCLTKGFEVH